MSKLSKKLLEIDFIKKGLCSNYWLWAHVLFSVILFNLFTIFLSDFISIFLILIFMILFEIIEFFIEGIEPYGSGSDWWDDTLGDIFFPLLIILIFLW